MTQTNNEREALILKIVRDVAELSDRNSPDDQPEIMLVSSAELTEILKHNLSQSPISQNEQQEAVEDSCNHDWIYESEDSIHKTAMFSCSECGEHYTSGEIPECFTPPDDTIELLKIELLRAGETCSGLTIYQAINEIFSLREQLTSPPKQAIPEGWKLVPIEITHAKNNWIKNTGEKPDGEFFHLHYKNGGYSFNDKHLKRPEIDWTLSNNGFSIVEYQVAPTNTEVGNDR